MRSLLLVRNAALLSGKVGNPSELAYMTFEALNRRLLAVMPKGKEKRDLFRRKMWTDKIKIAYEILKNNPNHVDFQILEALAFELKTLMELEEPLGKKGDALENFKNELINMVDKFLFIPYPDAWDGFQKRFSSLFVYYLRS